MSTIQQVCMYCDTPYGTKDGHGKTGVSHGMCPKCANLSDDERDEIANKKHTLRSFADFTDFTGR